MHPAPPAPPPGLRRRALALGLGAWGLWPALAPGLPARRLQFPRDHGSHPELRTEWWYITGHAEADGRTWGFQVTFFRSRVDIAQGLQSAFAARQLLFAHAALTDVQGQRLLHDQRIARAGFGVAQASERDTRIRLHDWTLERSDTPGPASRYSARIEGASFGLDLQFNTTQPVLLQGQEGLSRKGPEAAQASYYYSQPQLAVSGSLAVEGRRMQIAPGTGRAWLDHEWSDEILAADAVGWDWIGFNGFDGSALTAFQLRRRDGSALWAGGSHRSGSGALTIFGADDLRWTPGRRWRSPVTGADYPLAWQLATPVGAFRVRALLDAQELDSRQGTGTLYWEGLSELLDSGGRRVGLGYLEMTGYAGTLRL